MRVAFQGVAFYDAFSGRVLTLADASGPGARFLSDSEKKAVAALKPLDAKAASRLERVRDIILFRHGGTGVQKVRLFSRASNSSRLLSLRHSLSEGIFLALRSGFARRVRRAGHSGCRGSSGPPSARLSRADFAALVGRQKGQGRLQPLRVGRKGHHVRRRFSLSFSMQHHPGLAHCPPSLCAEEDGRCAFLTQSGKVRFFPSGS